MSLSRTSSWGQMWASPAKGLTVTVPSLRTTWLTEKPPSITGTPRIRQGKIPENIGMNVDAITDCKNIVIFFSAVLRRIFSCIHRDHLHIFEADKAFDLNVKWQSQIKSLIQGAQGSHSRINMQRQHQVQVFTHVDEFFFGRVVADDYVLSRVYWSNRHEKPPVGTDMNIFWQKLKKPSVSFQWWLIPLLTILSYPHQSFLKPTTDIEIWIDRSTNQFSANTSCLHKFQGNII